ncbi:class E sortase [Streptomyces sp. NPDC093600]|uniref:class E sortase n=1 Tax=Streptomyces sp. NPDC093600 TaxID=3366047 RepID=UPI003808E527
MTASPWFRATNLAEEPEPVPASEYGAPVPQSAPRSVPHTVPPASAPHAGPPPSAPEPISAPGYEETAYQPAYGAAAGYEPAGEPQVPQAPHSPRETPYEAPHEPHMPQDPYVPQEPYEPYDEPYDETMALRSVEPTPTPAPSPTPDLGPGRAERRRAAKGKGRRGAAPATSADAPAAPLSRVEARRAARARKESVGVVASRVVGELFITFGVVMLLFVAYQLWWTNVRAGQQTDKAKEQIEDAWSKGRAPEAFEPGQGFGIMYIPKLDVVVPIGEGVDKTKVLDRGMVGHYAEGTLKTAMPSDKQGNFALAGHRNTHGEPFRYINQLQPGDPIVVETQDAYYTYEMTRLLPQTPPSNVAVIDAVPKGSGFTGPGRYITLTTCTPEFTSTYRMIVWGKMVEERPRSKGKPDALVG